MITRPPPGKLGIHTALQPTTPAGAPPITRSQLMVSKLKSQPLGVSASRSSRPPSMKTVRSSGMYAPQWQKRGGGMGSAMTWVQVWSSTL